MKIKVITICLLLFSLSSCSENPDKFQTKTQINNFHFVKDKLRKDFGCPKLPYCKNLQKETCYFFGGISKEILKKTDMKAGGFFGMNYKLKHNGYGAKFHSFKDEKWSLKKLDKYSKYYGEWKDGKMHGYGMMINVSGYAFIGTWKNGRSYSGTAYFPHKYNSNSKYDSYRKCEGLVNGEMICNTSMGLFKNKHAGILNSNKEEIKVTSDISPLTLETYLEELDELNKEITKQTINMLTCITSITRPEFYNKMKSINFYELLLKNYDYKFYNLKK